MTSRRLPFTVDYLTPVNANLLETTLSDFISYPDSITQQEKQLSIGHHLVYFNPNTKPSSLLPDGTDPLHSPGPPFTRRMWAGGSIEVVEPIRKDGSPYHLAEKIVDVQVKGQENEEKIFVKIEREIYQRVGSDYFSDESKLRVREIRNIVFLRDKPQDHGMVAKQAPPKMLKPTLIPDVHHKLVPTPALLFRFSALTFNAHAIHLDKRYCQEVEGHRNLLVHGPLSVVLILEVLRSYLSGLNTARKLDGLEYVHSIEYRNLAPIYSEEELTVCLKRKEEGEQTGSFDVWIEGKDRGYAVKGVARIKTHEV